MLAKHQLHSWCQDLGVPPGAPFLAAAATANPVTMATLDHDYGTPGIND